MTNPYSAKSSEHFWKLAVAQPPFDAVSPVPAKRFRLTAADSVATAGSCFAQHVSAHLKSRSQVPFVEAETIEPGQPPFSALYGNIYTVRQLAQLVDEALGLRHPTDIAWKRGDGAYVDALRPTMFAQGFPDAAAVGLARVPHRAAVRSLLSKCSVLVFTLGLTEAWRSSRDGTVYPLAPGIVAEPERPADFEFHNFTYDEVLGDLEHVIARVHGINPGIRFIFTVSPVPLTATYGDEHVLVATSHSKAILRAACSAIVARHAEVYYFPAYEVITGNFTRGRYFEENLRAIVPEGVAHVMRVFEATYVSGVAEDAPAASAGSTAMQPTLFSEQDAGVICDEPEIVKSLGF